MTQAAPEFLRRLDRSVYAQALGISTSDMLDGVPVQVVSTGTPQAMVPVKSLAVLERVRPDLQHLSDLEEVGHYFSTHVFTPEAYDSANKAHARHFGPSSGVTEDPVTGSATGRDGGLPLALRPGAGDLVHGGAGTHHGAPRAGRG